jgi:prepilin-type processing-associated H-X9-DG protein
VSGLNVTAGAETVVVYEPVSNHGGDGMQVLYGDGHVDWLNKNQASQMLDDLKAGWNPPTNLGR